MTPAPSSRSGREKKPRRVSLKMTPASSSRSEREKERFRGVLEKQGPPPTKSPGSSERLLIEEKALLGPGHDRYAAIARYLGSCNNTSNLDTSKQPPVAPQPSDSERPRLPINIQRGIKAVPSSSDEVRHTDYSRSNRHYDERDSYGYAHNPPFDPYYEERPTSYRRSNRYPEFDIEDDSDQRTLVPPSSQVCEWCKRPFYLRPGQYYTMCDPCNDDDASSCESY